GGFVAKWLARWITSWLSGKFAMAPPRESRYDKKIWEVVDTLISILTVPFLHAISLFGSCYWITTFDKSAFLFMFMRFAVLGPIFFILAFVLSPFALVGYILWVLLNSYVNIQPFYSVSSSQSRYPSEGHYCQSKFTLCSANLLLCLEIIGRINNNRNVYWRVNEIARRLLHQNPLLNLNQNLQSPVNREDIVQSKLPEVNVFILQEVFLRLFGSQLIKHLKHKYPYIIYDVGIHRMDTNFCLLGSGLFLASEYPILEANFHPFTYNTSYGKLICYGVLLVKLDLGTLKKNDVDMQAVGYVANTHTQAFQGKDQVLVHQLEEVRLWMKSFIRDTHNADSEIVVFAVIGGDFNCDNMSSGDRGTQVLPLWNEYEDPCRVCAGDDQPWTIGTEHRQRMLHHPLVQNPETFRKILLDDIQRRRYILDATVKEQQLDMMWIAPSLDPSGALHPLREGGRRRIDHLIVRYGDEVSPSAFWFSTVIAGLTDHIPVALMLERKQY
ncbi:hypothetical protein OTU49_006972, partial [Cherax quadricarinatus]